jgi:hypothetical protein
MISGWSEVLSRACLMICLDSQLRVPTDVGYQTDRSSGVSTKLVSQKYFGSVLMIWTSALRTGSTVPSGRASISSGR